MKLRISGLLAIMASVVTGLLGSAESLAQYAYITNGASLTVSVIDTVRDKVTATIAGSFFAPYGVAVNPDGNRVYVTNASAGPGNSNLSVIDTATKMVIAKIPVGRQPLGVAVTRDGRRVYVANANSGSVSVIDTATNAVAATIPVGVGPYGVAVSPDGSTVYVTNTLLNSTGPRGNVSVIDA